MIAKVVRFFCHLWFGLWTMLGLIISWTGCHLVWIVGFPEISAQARCCKICNYIFYWLIIKPCPWIQVTPPPTEDVSRLLDRDRVCLLMNHTSFFDSILFVGIMPPGIIWRYRTLMKRSLFKV